MVCQGVHHVSVTWAGCNAHTGLGCTFCFISSCPPILSWPRKASRSISKSSIPPVPAVRCIPVFCTHERPCHYHIYLNKWGVISQLLLTSHWPILHSTMWELPGKAVNPKALRNRGKDGHWLQGYKSGSWCYRQSHCSITQFMFEQHE